MIISGESLEGNIKFIMSDGKVDAYDIPEIMAIVTECYNNLSSIKVTYEELPDINKLLITFLQNMKLFQMNKKPNLNISL